MDNSYGARPPWTGRPPSGAYPPQALMRNMQPGIDPRYMQDLNAHNGGQRMNGYGGMPGIHQGMGTPGSVGGGYPMWDMDVPSQMFMQTVNFDRMMQQQGMVDLNASVGTASNRPEDVSQRSEAGRDLIEQQQAMEQARLLQRFKELRHWQQQQQEVLMSQQHQQLSMLRKEQDRMQTMISKQRDNQWGGGHSNLYGNTETPPRRQIPQGTDISKLLESSHEINESKGALPRPIIYVQPKDDDDEIKTNPDLFSDTNSNRGSQAAMDDGMFPIPDSASEASVDVGMHQLRQSQVKSSVLRQRLNPHELDAPKKHHRSFAELEQDAEFMNLSSVSPTFQDMQHGKPPNERNGKIEEEHEQSNEEDDDDDTSDDDDEETSDEDDSDYDKEDTQIEVKKDEQNIDEVPIKSGIEGGKTFEQLLEEQLQAEEERLRQANMNQESPSQPKRTFLKKGEGIARFESKPAQRQRRPKKPAHKTAGSSSSKPPDPHKSSSNSSVQNKQASKVSNKPPSHNKTGNQASQKTTNQPLKLLKTDTKGKKRSGKSPARDVVKQAGSQDKKSEQNVGKKQSLKRNDSIPDDASFVASLQDRQKESERDMEDLDEFEILEHFADNMSFCSNSSIVTKGLHGLQNDRILSGVVPKSQVLARPASPRAMLIKKLELEKQAKMKQTMKQNSRSDSTKNDSATEIIKSSAAVESGKYVGQTVSSAGDKKFQNDDDDDDEYESVSDSSSDSSDSSEEDKVTQGVQRNSGSDLNRYLGVSVKHDSSHNEGKNDSVCSTDKKLERVLSYTGFTETSATSESEQDLDSDSVKDSSDEDVEEKSPSKIITRKVAGRDDKNKFPFQNLPTDSEFLQVGFNTSAYAPKAKSPIVISREKISEKGIKHELLREETKFSYHSDSDSVGNKNNDSFSEGDESQFEDKDKQSKKSFGEKKTLQFDDEEEWGELTPKVLKSRKRNDSEGDHDKTIVDDSEKEISSAGHNLPHLSDKNEDSTPPTSKLVTKLFPNLKPVQKKQEEHDLEKIHSATQSGTGDGVQSKVLRDKLMELEREIEKFRNENKHLGALRAEREQGLTKLKKEMGEFEKEKSEELKRIEEFRNEEMKKLKHEKKMFEKYQKAARAGPDKKEREEIENLKSQLAELQDEIKRKEGRWTANNSRLRDKIDQLEQENEELKEEINLLEKKRLEWMQKDQKNKSTKGGGQLLRSSTPTEEMDHLTNGHIEQGYNDLSGSTLSRLSVNSKPSQHHSHKSNIHSSHQPVTKSTVSQSAQNKHSNANQSAKPGAIQSNVKQNQPKKTLNTHNAKHGHTGTSHSLGNKAGHKSVGKSNTSVNSVKSSNSNDSKSVLRNSLTEDLPRRELGTIAEPQDLSMYSEAEVNVPRSGSTSLPRKFASSRPAVDTSVIDKGDNDEYDEVQHSDGKVERTYKTGAREILFSNGTRKEISADGKSIVVSFFNGDVKQIMGDQRVIYYYAENQTTHTNYPDGLEIIQFPNQQTEKLYPDGTKEITFPDQTIKYIFPNGSEESVFADGTVIRLEKNGDKTMEFPNGQREIHTQEYKKREYPDGTVKTVYPDGRQETRYSNGRLRVKDKDGNIIVDRQC